MRRQRRQDDSLEGMLGQRNRQNQQDDEVSMSVRYGDIEEPIIISRRRIEWREDPQNPGIMVPYTVNEVVYSTDDNGNPLGTTKKAGGCSFGHIVDKKTLSDCSICHSNICRRHTITVGSRKFCRGGFCFVMGALAWSSWLVFRMVAFCIMSILGIHRDEEPDVTEETPPVLDDRIRREVSQMPRIRRE